MAMKHSALGLLVLAGCADPIAADWNLVAWAGYPLVYTFEDCTITRSATLAVAEDLDASMVEQVSKTSTCYGDDYVSFWEGDVFALDDRRGNNSPGFYRIDLAAGEDALQLQCTLDAEGKALDCRDQVGTAWNFAP